MWFSRKNFDGQVEAYDSQTATEPAPNVEIYYNSASTASQTAYQTMTEVLDQYESHLANKFDVNNGQCRGMSYDLATKEDVTGQVFSMLLPMLMMIFYLPAAWLWRRNPLQGKRKGARLQPCW